MGIEKPYAGDGERAVKLYNPQIDSYGYFPSGSLVCIATPGLSRPKGFGVGAGDSLLACEVLNGRRNPSDDEPDEEKRCGCDLAEQIVLSLDKESNHCDDPYDGPRNQQSLDQFSEFHVPSLPLRMDNLTSVVIASIMLFCQSAPHLLE